MTDREVKASQSSFVISGGSEVAVGLLFNGETSFYAWRIRGAVRVVVVVLHPDRDVGEPDFHQLEPDVELAKPDPGTPTSRIVKRGRNLRIAST